MAIYQTKNSLIAVVDFTKLTKALSQFSRDEEKKNYLLKEKGVCDFFSLHQEKKKQWETLPLEHQLIYLSLICLEETFPLFLREKELKAALEDLIPVQRFFAFEGGILGYQKEVVALLHEEFHREKLTYHAPEGLDIRQKTALVEELILYGLLHLEEMVELYAVGGAADRLNLFDLKRQKELPAACLEIEGKSLLSLLIEDVAAKEYLYFKLTGKKITVPIVMMTSEEKQNKEEIEALCEKNGWFQRPKDHFYFFDQPLVPLVDREGRWQWSKEGRAQLKPGGHGVIWKLASDHGILQKLKEKKKKAILVRQINNPIAGVDYGLLAFQGYGLKREKKFGFASCERRIGSAEGMNILIEKENGAPHFALTNVEYCDFKKYGIEDVPEKEGSLYSQFPSNTNLLFARIDAIDEAVRKLPLPGKILNFKPLLNGTSEKKELARLETMMQNIADAFSFSSKEEVETFLTFNQRNKTISAIKRQYTNDGQFLETPEGYFYDWMRLNYELLKEKLGFELSPLKTQESFLKSPPFLFTYHKGLGPLYDIIAQKIRKGKLSYGAYLKIEAVEVDIEQLEVEGSLTIFAKTPYEEGQGKCGRACIKNVTVKNRGIDLEKENVFWKGKIEHKEHCHITLKGFSEFYAENITIEGSLTIVVEDGFRARAIRGKNGIEILYERIESPSWFWNYQKKENRIELEKKKLG